jgi:putative endonuclease
MNTKSIGNDGEEQAVCELVRLGYKIIDRNYQTRYGEIDIIAEDDCTLVFVEVKKKRSVRFGTPAEMVTKNKLRKIINMAEVYRYDNKQKGPFRVDVVCILGDSLELLRNVTNS